MGKTRLLQAVCAVAMLAATPAFAQSTETPTGTTGPHGAMNPTAGSATETPTGTMGPHGAMNSTAGSATENTTGSSAMMGQEHMHHHEAMHHEGMHHKGAAMHSRAGAGSAAVDRLNEQSYQAAQKGQPFSAGSDTGSMGMMGSGSGGAAGGSMPSSGAGGGAGGGASGGAK